MSSHQHSVLYAYNEEGDIFHPATSTGDGDLKVSNSSLTDGTQTTKLLTDRTFDLSGVNVYTGGTFADGGVISIDCVNYRSIRIFGSTTADLDITACNANNTSNVNFWAPIETISAGVTSVYYEDPPRNLRITNNSGSGATLKLHYARHL